MWIFGFGSLMWDGWHEKYGCQSKVNAELIDYRRRFNKASVKNWGTKALPGPTLNVEKADGSKCQGVVFHFSSEVYPMVLDYLKAREGKAFELTSCKVVLDGGEKVNAVVPIYRGRNILNKPIEQLVDMAILASGTSGRCVDYVSNIAQELEQNGIIDSEVEKFAAMVESKVNAQQGRSDDADTSRY